MGVVFHDDENQYYNSDGLHIGNKLQYHSSWDWLMPVVSKCRVESNPQDSHWEGIYFTLEDCDIKETYKAVVEFIKVEFIKQLNKEL